MSKVFWMPYRLSTLRCCSAVGIIEMLRAPTGALHSFLVLSTTTLDEYLIFSVGAYQWPSGGLGGSLLVHRLLCQCMLLGSAVFLLVLVCVPCVGQGQWVRRRMPCSIARPRSPLGWITLLPFPSEVTCPWQPFFMSIETWSTCHTLWWTFCMCSVLEPGHWEVPVAFLLPGLFQIVPWS